jgi:hypothetical protein
VGVGFLAEKIMNDEKLSDVPNKKWQEFFGKFSEIETLPVEQWKVPQVLGYFTKKYQEVFGKPYQFKFNTPLPLKSFEVWQVKSLSGKLSSKPQILKNYIDWFYQEINKNKKRFTSISAITKDEYVNTYKWSVLTSDRQIATVDRSAPLPELYQKIFAETDFALTNTYGDLSFLYRAYQSCNVFENETFIQMEKMFNKLIELGFDISILERIV